MIFDEIYYSILDVFNIELNGLFVKFHFKEQIINPNIFTKTIFIFREAGGPLDTLESFDFDEKNPHNFILYDKLKGQDNNEWKFRLPWPLIDMTTVKIPVRISFQMHLTQKLYFEAYVFHC